jgi:hypothetical protein
MERRPDFLRERAVRGVADEDVPDAVGEVVRERRRRGLDELAEGEVGEQLRRPLDGLGRQCGQRPEVEELPLDRAVLEQATLARLETVERLGDDGKLFEQFQQGLFAPVQILDPEHQRPVTRKRLEQPPRRPADLTGRSASQLEAEGLHEQVGGGGCVVAVGEESLDLGAGGRSRVLSALPTSDVAGRQVARRVSP